MKHDRYDVVVVGAGHAGCEAAHAAWRMGCRVALVTFRKSDIGVMSCNPAIGGLGKGHLVREVDAMDGLIGRVADRAGIQFRLLNRRKGPAVQGPRLQADRALYQAAMAAEIGRSGITVTEAEVVDVPADRAGHVAGVELSDGVHLPARCVVLTSGTFLRGVIRIGDASTSGGRYGARSAERLAARVRDLGVHVGRLKTGTPPRLHREGIDWDALERQPGDDRPVMMSFLHDQPFVRQIDCAITHTNERTHEIVRENLSRSAMYGGRVEGVGPRYCPSIEDKVVKFADKESHQIFLEPEGLESDLVYPNGLSTSLPADVQDEYVRSIRGLKRARIVQSGYAIEYDHVDPRALDRRLHMDSFPGLFLAGQINGTTGYEEAAAQGLVAGVNAALAGQENASWLPSRAESYIGVMVDDLVTRGVTEPYRMFTSRAEFRLTLRADNADARLTASGVALGCVGESRRTSFDRKCAELLRMREELADWTLDASQQRSVGAAVRDDAPRRDAFAVIGMAGVDNVAVGRLALRQFGESDRPTIERLAADSLYSVYSQRQAKEAASLRAAEDVLLPSDLDYRSLGGLSTELREKLMHGKPGSLGQASRIEGMTPAALVSILAAVKRQQSRSA